MKKLLLFATLLIVNYSLSATSETVNGTKTRVLEDKTRHLVCWEIDSENEKCVSIDFVALHELIKSVHPNRKSETNTSLWYMLYHSAKPQLKSLNDNKKELSEKECEELLNSSSK